MCVERLFIVCSRPQILGVWTYVVRSCQIWSDWLVCLVKVFCVLERLRFSGQLCWVHNFFNRISSLPLLVLRNGHRSWSSLALKKTRFWNLYSNQMTCLDRSILQSFVFMFKGFWGHFPWKLECRIVMNSPNILTEMDNQALSLYIECTPAPFISFQSHWMLGGGHLNYHLQSSPWYSNPRLAARIVLDSTWAFFRPLKKRKNKEESFKMGLKESFTDIKWQTLQLTGQWPTARSPSSWWVPFARWQSSTSKLLGSSRFLTTGL